MRTAILAAAGLCAVACATTETNKEDIPPEAATGLRQLEAVTASKYMVSSANPHATRAGLEILRQGGSAVDATIAMAVTITMTEPQSSGIGGGAFLMHFEAKNGDVQAFDGRETAPASARGDMFLDAAGKPRTFWDAVVGGLSVGVPGQLRMLELAHKTHGELPWKALFQPAIRLADGGFEVSNRLHLLLGKDPFLKTMAVARAHYYTADGAPKPVGTVLKNPAYAATLRAVAAGGADAFYTGAIAADIARAVTEATRNATPLTAADLSAYKAMVRAPVCGGYRTWEVCGMPPPTSGGITPLQILGVLSHFDVKALGADSVEMAHLFAEASRLAYADRGLYLADPDFVKIPSTLLDPDYLAQRAKLIDMTKSMGKATAGTPPGAAALERAEDASLEIPSTSHMVAVDAAGNAVSMTASIESAFGSRIMVGGFLLNNELTDFSFVAARGEKPVANRVEPNKRPRSSMSPVLVFHPRKAGERRRLHLAVGSPGGSRIIEYVTLALVRILDHGIALQDALGRPNIVNRNGKTELERMAGQAAWAERMRAGLLALGHEVQVRDLNSGLQALMAIEGGYVGAADPRREGIALGD